MSRRSWRGARAGGGRDARPHLRPACGQQAARCSRRHRSALGCARGGAGGLLLPAALRARIRLGGGAAALRACPPRLCVRACLRAVAPRRRTDPSARHLRLAQRWRRRRAASLACDALHVLAGGGRAAQLALLPRGGAAALLDLLRRGGDDGGPRAAPALRRRAWVALYSLAVAEDVETLRKLVRMGLLREALAVPAERADESRVQLLLCRLVGALSWAAHSAPLKAEARDELAALGAPALLIGAARRHPNHPPLTHAALRVLHDHLTSHRPSSEALAEAWHDRAEFVLHFVDAKADTNGGDADTDGATDAADDEVAAAGDEAAALTRRAALRGADEAAAAWEAAEAERACAALSGGAAADGARTLALKILKSIAADGDGARAALLGCGAHAIACGRCGGSGALVRAHCSSVVRSRSSAARRTSRRRS